MTGLPFPAVEPGGAGWSVNRVVFLPRHILDVAVARVSPVRKLGTELWALKSAFQMFPV